MALPLNIAEKLLLMIHGEKIASGKLKHPIIAELIKDGILLRPGKTRSIVQLIDQQQLKLYLLNHYSIDDLERYIETLKKEELIRADLVAVATDSKLKAIRSFKGFLINCYEPIPSTLNGETYIVNPTAGTFSFIYDFETFIPAADVTIIGIENPENFMFIRRQRYLFDNLKTLFVSRYPQNQSKDQVKWLKMIPNNYLHFGDFDFAGIGIYLNEFRKHLGSKASFYIPDNIDELIHKFGSRNRYDVQRINFNTGEIEEQKLLELIDLIHRHKKGLDQEIFISLFYQINQKPL